MSQKKILSGLGLVVALGSVWGLAEAGLGLALASCAKLLSGSIMTGAAVFFLASARLRSKSAWGPVLAVSLALGFKLFDAALLGLPLRHGAVANPMFAFVLEGGAIILLFALWGRKGEARPSARAGIGAGTALLAAGAFPLVKLATGIPACVLPGSAVPLAIVFAPVAAVVGALAAPLAYAFVHRMETWEAERGPALGIVLPAAAAFLSLLAVAVIRIV